MGLLCLKHCWMGDLNPPGTTAPLSSPLGGVSCECAAPQLKDAGRGRMCLCFGLSLFLPVRVIPIRVSPQPCSCLQDLCSYSNPGLTAGESPLRGSGCTFPGEQQNVTAESEAGLCHICHSPAVPAQTELSNFLTPPNSPAIQISPGWPGGSSASLHAGLEATIVT